MTPHTSLIRSSVVALLVVAAAACGSPTNKIASPTTAIPSTAATTSSEPQIIDSVTAETVDVATDDSTLETVAETLRDGVPIELGTTYAVVDPSTGNGFSLVSSVDGAYPFLVINAASLSLDEAGNQGLISIFSLDPLRTFLDPAVDIMAIPPSEVEAATEPVATDHLAWFGTLPGVTVGPVEETTVDGWPARSMTYEFGPSVTGLPCDDTSLAGCTFTFWNPAGSATYYAPNDIGTLYEVVLDGSRTLVDVSFRPGAQEMFETLHFLLESED